MGETEFIARTPSYGVEASPISSDSDIQFAGNRVASDEESKGMVHPVLSHRVTPHIFTSTSFSCRQDVYWFSFPEGEIMSC